MKRFEIINALHKGAWVEEVNYSKYFVVRGVWRDSITKNQFLYLLDNGIIVDDIISDDKRYYHYTDVLDNWQQIQEKSDEDFYF